VNPFIITRRLFLQERDRWLLWIPAALGAGIATYFSLPFEPPLWALLATPVVAAIALFLRRFWTFFLLAAVVLIFVLGFNAAQLETHMLMKPMLDRQIGPVGVTGRLIYTEVMPEGVRLTLKDLQIGHLTPEQTPAKIRIKLNNKSLADVPPTGSIINLWAQVGPFSDPVMPGATDFRWQGYFKQIGGLGWSFSAIKLVDPAPETQSWRDRFNLMFERARITLSQHVYERLADCDGGGDVAAMTAARLNGEQSAISKPVIEAMRIAGLAHLLSTSGFHVTIMALLVYFPLRAMLALIPWVALRCPIKKWAAFGALLSATGYTLLVGSQAATLRSMIMTGIAMLAIIVDRRSAPMRLVILSAALVMLIEPDAMLGPSFQMSFAAVFCLIAFNEQAFAWTTGDTHNLGSQWLRSVGHHFWVIMRTSLIATAATTPFAVYHFQTFSFYGFIANMIAIPMTSFWVMPCILMAYITVPFGLDGWFIDGAGAGIAVTIRIAEKVASWPYSIIYLPAMPPYVLVMIVLGGLWFCLWRKNWRYWGLVPVAIGAFYMFYTPQPDVMISSDGREWAAKLDDGRLAVSNLDHDAFSVDQWQQRLGNIPTVDVFQLDPNEAQLRCDDAGCVYHHGSYVMAFPIMDVALLEDCEQADIVVAAVGVKKCRSAYVLDEPEFWFHGAHTIRFYKNGIKIEAVRAKRGMRPWSPGWKQNNNQFWKDED
jgi:competence protein ComEC